MKGAEGFCPKCADFLCKACLDNHGEQQSSPGHKILTGSAMPAKQSEKPLKYDSCDHHPTELKDTYCLDHGIFVCGKCASKEHTNCDVKSIILAFKSFNISAEDQAFKGTASHFLGHAQQLQMSVEENLVELEKQKNNLIHESQEFRTQITNQIRQSCEDFERKVLRNYVEKKGALAQKLGQINEVVSQIEGSLEDLQRQGIRTLGEARYFMHLKRHTETVLACSEKIKDLHENLSYIDMTSQFYLCINPIVAPQNKFLDISLNLENYEYENNVPDIHIPCINKQPEKSDAAYTDLVSQGDMPVPPTRRQKASARTINVQQTMSAASQGDQTNPPLSPVSDTSENSDVSNADPESPTDDKDTKSESQSDFTVLPAITRRGSATGSRSTDDQKLKGSAKGGSFTKGEGTFRRLSLALEASAKNLPSSVVILDPIKVAVHGDERVCLILGVDVTSDGNVLLLDRNNRKLKMFTQGGDYMASRKLPKNPEGLAVISDTKAAISTFNKIIGIVDITPHGGLALKKTLQLDYSVWGIAGYRDHLIVTCSPSPNATQAPTSVRMIDLHGRVKWSATTDANDAELFQWAGFLTVRYGASKDTVVITDQFKQTLTILNAHNGSVLKVVSVAGRTPKGVTADENGDVFVCYDSGAITLWTADMSKEKNPGTVDMKEPYAIAYDKKQKELFVASHAEEPQYSDVVHRYHYRR